MERREWAPTFRLSGTKIKRAGKIDLSLPRAVLIGRACARTLGAEAGVTEIGAGHRALQGLSGDRERRRGNGHGNEDAWQRVASSAETRSIHPHLPHRRGRSKTPPPISRIQETPHALGLDDSQAARVGNA